ncbi:universal stress protein [Pseudoalteromonas prydzensis]|uniref:universal stress protein n=1 Tax=Pseudoalteromonas prydzensis TaxID=182141 RepID=UPI0024BCC834|nr:universal stress protein [Pseudoalteromonas prydzensis]
MKRFKNIVYVVNNNSHSSSSLLRVVSLAKNNQADLTLLSVIPKLSLSSYPEIIGASKSEVEQTLLERNKVALEQVVASLELPSKVTAMVAMGKVYLETMRAVQDKNFDLVIKEAGSASWLDRLLGSDELNLLRMCPTPVWLMKENEQADYKNILAAVSFDDDEGINTELNSTLVELASSLALSDFASLHIANVFDTGNAGFIGLWAEDPVQVEKQFYEAELLQSSRKINVLLNSLQRSVGEHSYQYLATKVHIKQGEPAEELVKLASHITADLVVIGTNSRGGIAAAVLGNTVETVLSQLNCSVLAVKPSGFVAPAI